MKYLLLLIAIVISVSSFPQSNMYFRHFTNDEGLPSNYVETILQTSDGFMWFGTSDGLSRFDGISFYNFRNSPNDTTSLINNEIKCLLQDKSQRLWVGTQKGLTFLDLKTYKFKHFTDGFRETIGNHWISSLLNTENKTLLIGTYGNGLYIFDYDNHKLINYSSKPENNSLVSNYIRHLCFDNCKNLWIATDMGLDVLNFKTMKFSHLLEGQIVFYISPDRKGNVLVTTLSSPEIYTFNPNTLKITNSQKLDKKFKEKAKKIFFDASNNRWLSLSGQGIFIFKPGTDSIRQFITKDFSSDGLSSNNPLTVYEDKHENMWIGTFDAGISLLNKHRKLFIQVKSGLRKDDLLNRQVRSIYQDLDGDIWIGTKSGGMLSRFNRNNFLFTHYRNNPVDRSSLNDDIVMSITDGLPGYIWVGTLTGGINILNKQTGKFSFLNWVSGRKNQIASNNIPVLYSDKHGKIWIGHSINGADVYDLASDKIIHYSHSSEPQSISDNRVRVFFRDSRGNMWIGTMQGLNLFIEKENAFRRFLNNPDDPASISGDNITCINEDSRGNIWIGTTNGFNKWDSLKQNFKVFNKSGGFPGNSVRGLLFDAEDNLWIGTDIGLVKYNVKKSIYRHYTKEDGLNSNEIMQYANCHTQNGELIFGTANGFVLFRPEEITDNKVLPDVVITGFKLFNQIVSPDSPDSPLESDITCTKHIILTYRQSVFTLEFAALNYTTPEKNQYAYMLEGFEKDWNYTGNKRDATYTNLPAGNYIFRVKASNNDGLWNEQGTSLKIVVLPPPWKTWWAFLIYFVLIIIILLKYRNITIKRIHAEKEHEIDLMKIKLFMNISHEFRTPLTLMINPLIKIENSEDIHEIKASVKTAQRSSWKLLNLVNQLLDFRKIDQGGAPLKAGEGDIVALSRQITALFEEPAKSKNIQIQFASDHDQLNVWLDPGKYEKILNNLLSNALKFTDAGGKIQVQVGKTSLPNRHNWMKLLSEGKIKEFVEVKVIDTGIGLTKEEIKNIFERFYQVDHLKAGTGIGLNYVKSLVELHGGEVIVESQPGAGSSFIVRIPLGNKHLKPEQKELAGKGFGEYLDKVAIESLQYDIDSSDVYTRDEKEADKEENRENKVILLVEDNKALRKQIADEFKDIYILKEASNGSEGLEKAIKLMPDLIISDIMMPKMDGIEFCRHIKTDIQTCHIPVILLTAKGTIEDKMEGFETGADEYIPKPFNMQLLGIRMKNLIQGRMQLKAKFSSGKIIEPAKEYTTNNLDEAFLEKATEIVLENVEDMDFSLSDLCEQMNISSSGLYKKLQAITGQNPSGFVRTIRLKYAANLVLENNMSVKNICYKCGFNSPAYFIKTFRELYGQTPKEYFESFRKEKG